MMGFHLLRPWWLLSLLPLLIIVGMLWCKRLKAESWAAICDKHLLEPLLLSREGGRRPRALFFLFLSGFFMVIALSGPSWTQLPIPTYKQIQPRVIILDMSEAMLVRDLSPDRLTRAKFKLHDLFQRRVSGQFALVVYTGEPFVVAPLTDDAKTIDSLLSALTPDIMPVEGQQLDAALKQAAQLITKAGFNYGQLLVLTAETPSNAALKVAENLASKHIFTSVMPVKADSALNFLFQKLAQVGGGQLLNLHDNAELEKWLDLGISRDQYYRSQLNDIPLWQDEGRWFILPALLFLFPVFRRRWLQRI
jgi:Ca-activated chloride channel family protein